ncbi:hypothetical protein CH275_12130 [Rhodococcus sp. 06-235-1A]|uniref:hypothetical protein n=1 Tax=Rhodococcus sp. 06-235-1A TaxID=2022508 RepID=UPI000B9B5515|nr:hypothetical protein [Rhodococcus sp. 06-235-1A]OZD05112.1 hypothetical protein CH275_12130 [Rhodococcus sp. 06-235-1A]
MKGVRKFEWVGIDNETDEVVGVLATAEHLFPDIPVHADVVIIHSRRHHELGIELLVRAKRELSELDLILYRSGTATEKGLVATTHPRVDLRICPNFVQRVSRFETSSEMRRSKMTDPRTSAFEPVKAVALGREYLSAAADRLGLKSVPPKLCEPKNGAAGASNAK